MSDMFVVVLIEVKPNPRLILQYGVTSYLVTNADWNYSEEKGHMSGDQREPDSVTNILPINEIREWQCGVMGSHKRQWD